MMISNVDFEDLFPETFSPKPRIPENYRPTSIPDGNVPPDHDAPHGSGGTAVVLAITPIIATTGAVHAVMAAWARNAR